MSSSTVTIRELRTNFRQVKRKIEMYGAVTITDDGEPAYVLKPLPRPAKKPSSVPDYYARLLKRQPTPMSHEETKAFWEDGHGPR